MKLKTALLGLGGATLAAVFAVHSIAIYPGPIDWANLLLTDGFNATDRRIETQVEKVAEQTFAKTHASVNLEENQVLPIIKACIAQEGIEPVSNKPFGNYSTHRTIDKSRLRTGLHFEPFR